MQSRSKLAIFIPFHDLRCFSRKFLVVFSFAPTVMQPLSPDDGAYYVGESGYFQNEIPSEHASFLYDDIINAGIAACHSVENGTDHIEEVVASDFEGASGRTVFYDDTYIPLPD
jgi:hypothetical protein